MGLAALDVAKNVMGCRVICAAGSDAKCQTLLELGADEVVNYSDEPRFSRTVKGWAGGDGVTAVFDVVGGDVLSECVRCAAPFAKLLLIGFTAVRANDLKEACGKGGADNLEDSVCNAPSEAQLCA